MNSVTNPCSLASKERGFCSETRHPSIEAVNHVGYIEGNKNTFAYIAQPEFVVFCNELKNGEDGFFGGAGKASGKVLSFLIILI